MKFPVRFPQLKYECQKYASIDQRPNQKNLISEAVKVSDRIQQYEGIGGHPDPQQSDSSKFEAPGRIRIHFLSAIVLQFQSVLQLTGWAAQPFICAPSTLIAPLPEDTTRATHREVDVFGV